MILGVDGIRLVRNRSGVARALEALLLALVEIPGQPFDQMRVYTPEPVDPVVRLPAIAKNVVVPSPLPVGLWQQCVLPWVHGRRDVLLCPSYVLPVAATCPTLLIHHGSYEGYAEASHVFSRWSRFKARISYPMSARRATTLVTVSEYSRRDMAHFYGLPPERIRVIPEGVDTKVFRPISDRAAISSWRERVLGQDTPFLLYVGKPTKRRNIPNLLRAFATLKREHHVPHKLLLIGGALPGVSFHPLIHELGLGGDIVIVPYASHEDIALAYNATSAVLYPSSYEGFGMPVLEAMACGAPVIALNNTAFPEFAGGVAVLLDDASVDTLTGGILQVLNDDALRARMRVLGPERAARYDWHIIAGEYLPLLRALIPGQGRSA
jgi:glycosyltransferase involved in cell wall biosynthesis